MGEQFTIIILFGFVIYAIFFILSVLAYSSLLDGVIPSLSLFLVVPGLKKSSTDSSEGLSSKNPVKSYIKWNETPNIRDASKALKAMYDSLLDSNPLKFYIKNNCMHLLSLKQQA